MLLSDKQIEYPGCISFYKALNELIWVLVRTTSNPRFGALEQLPKSPYHVRGMTVHLFLSWREDWSLKRAHRHNWISRNRSKPEILICYFLRSDSENLSNQCVGRAAASYCTWMLSCQCLRGWLMVFCRRIWLCCICVLRYSAGWGFDGLGKQMCSKIAKVPSFTLVVCLRANFKLQVCFVTSPTCVFMNSAGERNSNRTWRVHGWSHFRVFARRASCRLNFKTISVKSDWRQRTKPYLMLVM